MSFEDPGDTRYVPDDGCPLFSERLEQHLVGVLQGQAPNRGHFCGNCYTPLSADSPRCPHCGEDTRTGRSPVEAVPQPVVDALARQRSIESRWVTGLAYLGVLIAVVGGISFVLAVPYFRERLIAATILYGAILLIGSRVLAGVLGGYYGDRIGFARARAQTRATWDAWVAERE